MSIIMITRPAHEAVEVADRVAAAGFEPLIEPLLHIELLPDAVPDLTKAQAVIFTSANAVRAVGRAVDIPVFAVGDKTAAAAAGIGFRKIHVAGGDAAALSALLALTDFAPGKPVFHLSGRDIAADITVPGVIVERHIVYHAEKNEEFSAEAAAALRAGAVAGVMLWSARTGEAFAAAVAAGGLVEGLKSTKALCLSHSVLQSVSHLPWRGRAIAEKPDSDHICDLLAETAL
jgi:uroporphyrinogen-III synthase